MDPVQVNTVTVGKGRLICEVQLGEGAPRQTTPQLAAAVTRRHPDLPRHACVNDVGRTFGDVMDATSVPHLLEHVVIDLQVRAHADSSKTFVGTTEWIDEQAGCARVEVSFLDDLEALSALCDALALLNELIRGV